jgi:hypothetical protein
MLQGFCFRLVEKVASLSSFALGAEQEKDGEQENEEDGETVYVSFVRKEFACPYRYIDDDQYKRDKHGSIKDFEQSSGYQMTRNTSGTGLTRMMSRQS